MSELWVGPLDDPDRIRLGPAVAAGTEGVLYRANIDTPDGPLQIALKMLQPGHLGNLSEWMDRWQAQVELLVRVRIPGLVAVRGGFVGALPHLAGQADASVRSLYLHMDWVEGIPLDRWVRAQTNAEPEQLLASLVPVAAALDLLHSGAATDGVAVIHRDVKPANILIRPGGDTVLVDVGALRNTASDSRRSGVVGTPGYIAPEVRRDGAYSPASDRYALGAVAFFLLTRDEPPPDADIDELRQHLARAPLLQGRPDVVDHVAAMLDPDPDARPTPAANWVAQLRRSSLAVLPGDLRIAPRAPGTRSNSRKGGLARGERDRGSRHGRVAAAGLLLSGVLSLVLLNAESGENSPTPTAPTTTFQGGSERVAADIAELARLRSQDLLQRSRNAHELLREIARAGTGVANQLNRVNDLNNELVKVWMAIARTGLGDEPYTSRIEVRGGEWHEPEPTPSFGSSEYRQMGFPRLHITFLQAKSVPDNLAMARSAEFSSLVRPYSAPARYPHQGFYDRAYNEYGLGRNLDSEQWVTDLQTLDTWLSELENVLSQIPQIFQA